LFVHFTNPCIYTITKSEIVRFQQMKLLMKRIILMTLSLLLAIFKSGIAQTESDSTIAIFENFTEAVNGINIDMIAIHGGHFIMGYNSDLGKEYTVHSINEPIFYDTPHSVELSNFYIGMTEVTFDQYKIYCDATGKEMPYQYKSGCGNKPVVGVSWDEATAYCEWLSKITNKLYRLPSEAEWEYACRAGTNTLFNTGDSINTSQANYAFSYQTDKTGTIRQYEITRPVGSYHPNDWGLYDMHGNAREWCADYCDKVDGYIITDTFYEGAINPVCRKGSFRIIRGGSMASMPDQCTSYSRRCFSSDRLFFDTGFRLACSINQ